MADYAGLVDDLRAESNGRRSHAMLCGHSGGGGCFHPTCSCWCHRHDDAAAWVEVPRAMLADAADVIEAMVTARGVLREAVVDAHDHLEELTGPAAMHQPRVLSADAVLRAALDQVSA